MLNQTTTVDELQDNWRDQYAQWYAAGMPAYNNSGKVEYKQIRMKFRTKEDRAEFGKKIGAELTDRTGVISYPLKSRAVNLGIRYEDERTDTKYPIYIISKGRWDSRYTSKALEKLGVPYFIAVEPQEYDNYCAVIDPAKVLKLPFSNHGKGSGPARNWCWDHSKANGYKRHWLMDDNIADFYRFHNNVRLRVEKGSAIFRSTEDFVDRFENVAIAGLQYKFFCVDGEPYPPYILNTRVMSCFLIDNDCPERWRGKYNEDVDLSIRVLKRGLVTMLVYAFLCGKLATGTVKGGNTSELYNNYQGDGSLNKSKMLQQMHPDVVTLVEKYGRIHHHVDLDKIINDQGFQARQNAPILRKDVDIVNNIDNYGMNLIREWGTDAAYIDHEFTKHVYPSGRKNGHK